MTAGSKTKAAVLISGRGSNMKALVDAAKDPDFPTQIILVLSDTPEAGGLEIAEQAGVACAVVERADFPDRAAFEDALVDRLRAAGCDLVCLAGFMRILGPRFISCFQGKILNIHPSLLPDFPGLDTHARALAAGVAEHGCSVHFVNEGMDEGPVIGQAKVPVAADDTPESLAARVLEKEHQLYPACLKLVAEGRVTYAGQAAAGRPALLL